MRSSAILILGCMLAAGAIAIEPTIEEEGPAGIRVVVPPSVVAGQALHVAVYGLARDDAFANPLEIVNDEQLTVTEALPIHGRFSLAPAHHYLLGVDSLTPPGSYRLRVGDRELAHFEVLPGDYRSVEIPLNSALTSIRRDYDPQKVAETEELTRLVLSRDAFAVYHQDALGWPLPADTRQTGLFGDRRIYIYANGQRARTIHFGLDLAAPVGTPLVSAGAGVVRMAKDRIVTGGTVVIEHLPGVFSLYYHLDSIDVEVGSMVAEGDPIGTVGSTGLSTGPHLHWEVRIGGVPVSPQALTEKRLVDGGVP